MVWLSVLQGIVGIEGWAVLGTGRVVRAAGERVSLEKKEKNPPFARSKTAKGCATQEVSRRQGCATRPASELTSWVIRA
jgi:hypothetical protein